jgi:hypothetical protein
MNHGISPDDRFAIVPIPGPGPAPDNAMIVGSMSAVMECIPQSIARNEAEETLKQHQITALIDNVAKLSTRLDLLLQRKGTRARKKKEAEQKRIADDLAALPDPDDPATHGHMPGGELHTISAKVEQETDDAGGVPLSYGNVPTSYVHSEDDPTNGTAIPQPTAIGFDGD